MHRCGHTQPCSRRPSACVSICELPASRDRGQVLAHELRAISPLMNYKGSRNKGDGAAQAERFPAVNSRLPEPASCLPPIVRVAERNQRWVHGTECSSSDHKSPPAKLRENQAPPPPTPRRPLGRPTPGCLGGSWAEVGAEFCPEPGEIRPREPT